MKRLILICLMILFLASSIAIAEPDENTYDTWFAARDENGLYGYINRQGEWMIVPQYVFADTYFTGDYIRVGMDNIGVGKRQGVIDRQGNWILPPEYELYPMDYMGDNENPGEGLLAVTPTDGSSNLPQGYFDLETGFFSGLKWYCIFPRYTDSPLIAVFPDKMGSAGYANRWTGELVLPALYESVDPQLFYQGLVLTAYEDEEQYENGLSDCFLMDETGTVIPFPDGITGVEGDVSCGRVPIQNGAGRMGFADLQGNVVIQPQFEFAFHFAEDRAVVEFPEGDSGIIDLDGNILTRGFTWSDGWFQNGIITAKRDDESACYGLDGQRIDTLPADTMAVNDDLYWIGVAGSGYNVIWCLSDRDGHALSDPCRLTYHAEEYHDFFDEGLQPVGNEEGKWGYMNMQGEMSIDFVYDRTEPFRYGLALVEKDGKMMYIDHSGAVVWEER